MTTPADNPTIAPGVLLREPSPEFVTREALRLMAAWSDADDPEQYVDDVRIALAVGIVRRTYAHAKEQQP